MTFVKIGLSELRPEVISREITQVQRINVLVFSVKKPVVFEPPEGGEFSGFRRMVVHLSSRAQ